MAYNSLIPQANDLLSQSQGDILANFTAIKTLVDVDHVSFSAPGEGKHNRVSLPVQASSPLIGALAFAAGEVGLYSFLNPTTSKNELYINKTNNSGIVQIPATTSILGTSNPTPGTFGNTTGWTMLPSGIKMVWGSFVGNGVSSQTVTLAGAQAFATTILSVQLTIISTSTTFGQAMARLVSSPTANTFDVVVSNATGTAFSASNVMFLAIGY